MTQHTGSASPMRLGAFTVLTDEGIQPGTLASALEERGFESCFLGEHSHVPVHRETPNPHLVFRSLDPIVALTAMAGATERLRLGTAVALVVQRDPIYLAKEVATLDLLSGGRVELGVGAGWLIEEMRNHGTDPASRGALLRERVLAMKAIWTHEAAEFHGDLVDFDPIYQWPKPVQRPHPPVLLGGWGPSTYRRVLDYADGWLPVAAGRSLDELAAGIGQLQQHAKEQDRGPVPVTAAFADPSLDDLARAADIGVDRALVMVPDGAQEKETLELLDHYTGFLAR
jgi:probable F420-dependent oxidoreductase